MLLSFILLFWPEDMHRQAGNTTGKRWEDFELVVFFTVRAFTTSMAKFGELVDVC